MFSFQSKIQLKKHSIFKIIHCSRHWQWLRLPLLSSSCMFSRLTYRFVGSPTLHPHFLMENQHHAHCTRVRKHRLSGLSHRAQFWIPPPKKIIKDLKTTSSAFNWGWEQARNDNHQFCVSQEPQCRLPASTVARSKPDLPYKHTVLGARAAAAFSWAEMYFGKEGRLATKSHMNFALSLWRS